MTIGYVGVGIHNAISGSSGTQSYEWPSAYTPTAGDIAFVFQAGWWTQTTWGACPDGPIPTGFTHYSKYYRDASATLTLGASLYYKVLDGTESVPTVSTSATYTGLLHGFTFVFSGVHNSSIFATSALRNASGTAATFQFSPFSVTTTTNGIMLFQVVAAGVQNAIFYSSAYSYTLRAGGASYDTSTGSNGSTALSTRLQSTAGSVSSAVYDGTADSSWAGIQVQLSPASAPDAPTNLSVTPNAVKGFALSWNAPGDNGQPITTYTVQWSTDNATWTTYGTTTSATSLNVTDPGTWTNGTLYYFKVKATNSIGDGPYSSSASGTSWAVPSAPGSLTVGTVTPTTIPLTWTAPSDGGTAITDYVVEYSLNNSTWTTFTDGVSTATSATIDLLTSSTLYYLRVAAVNAVGTSSYATTTGTTAAPPAYWGINDRIV